MQEDFSMVGRIYPFCVESRRSLKSCSFDCRRRDPFELGVMQN